MTEISETYYADLHNHTTASDGSFTPTDLIKHASEIGLKAIAVTDHDTIDGLQEALLAGQKFGVEVITGTEITLRFKEPYFTGSLHLLVYFDKSLLDNDSFVNETVEALSKGRGPALVTDRIAAINQVFGPESATPGLPRNLTEDDVYAHGDRISRRHFALALNDLGLTDRDEVSAIIGNDSPAYIPSGAAPESLKAYLSRWPLARILAHPAAGSYPGESLYREVLPPFEVVEKLLPVFLDLGLDGLEVNYPGHTEEWRSQLQQRVNEMGLSVVTGGSDCHDKEQRPLGVCGVSQSDLETLKGVYTP